MSYQGDLELSCGQLSQEAIHMRDRIQNTQQIKNQSKRRSHGITAAGAVGSLLIGTATGGVGLAAAGFLMEQGVSNTSENAEDIQNIAQQRRSLMMGIYSAKGCYGPMDHAMQNPDLYTPPKTATKIKTANHEPRKATISNDYND